MIEKYAASISTDLIVVSRRDLETAESLGIQSGNQAAFIPNGIDFLTPDYRELWCNSFRRKAAAGT